MSDRLGTWAGQLTGAHAELELHDTNRTDSYGKSVLRYVLTITPKAIVFEGDDFCCAPSVAIDSDEAAGACLSFFAHYGESIRYSGDDADVPTFTREQREALVAYGEEISMWSMELEGEDEDV